MKKLYYSIGEVSKITDVEPYVLRYWETKFEKLKPSKNRAGKRIYTEDDINTVLKLKVLIRDKKFSTEGAVRALNAEKKKNDSEQEVPVQVVRDLKEIKIFLQGLLEEL